MDAWRTVRQAGSRSMRSFHLGIRSPRASQVAAASPCIENHKELIEMIIIIPEHELISALLVFTVFGLIIGYFGRKAVLKYIEWREKERGF